MTVAEIERIGSPEIARHDARRAFVDYRKAVHTEKNPARRREYEGLMRGYRAIAAGKQVIDLLQTMKAAGIQPDTLYPRLAIARADCSMVRVRMVGDGAATFYGDPPQFGRVPKSRTVQLPKETLVQFRLDWQNGPSRRYWEGQWRTWSPEATAVVPIVPASLHPGPALSNYHTLWDAVWTPEPPRDPLLLKHLSGSLYAIVAHWDLSPLERAVLAGRL